MTHFSTVDFQLNGTAGLAAFYCDILGMVQGDTDERNRFCFPGADTFVSFQTAVVAAYSPQPDDLYWKIGVTVPDLDAAVRWVKEMDWPVTEPRQFRDIGYMAHLRDPNGFAIELLQHGFEGNRAPYSGTNPIGRNATLAHITLRVGDISRAKSFCEERLGMRLMSVQPVPERHFCLYFYSWSDEPLPQANLEAVGNREWLWARPYTILELQHLTTPGTAVRGPDGGAAGFCGFSLSTGRAWSARDLAQMA